MHPLKLLRLKSHPIYQQLQLEGALLRTDDANWCIINEGSPPAIVMGISGVAEKLIHMEHIQVPVIKRFSGGGTVVVDERTLFVSFLGNHSMLNCEPFPCKIMRWTADIYRPLLTGQPFALRENDYVIGERKFGGNAQSLVRGRWLHHSTLLWDYLPERMSWLKMPEKRPAYREQRSHAEFLCTLKELYPSLEGLANAIDKRLEECFQVERVSLGEASVTLSKEHRRATTLL